MRREQRGIPGSTLPLVLRMIPNTKQDTFAVRLIEMALLLPGVALREPRAGQTEEGWVQSGGPEIAGWGSEAQMWLFYCLPHGTQSQTSFMVFATAINYLNTYSLTLVSKWGFKKISNEFI